MPACRWLAGSLVGVGPALRVACAWVPLGGAGVYGVGRVPGWYGTGASGCLRPGAVWWGRHVRGWQGPGLVWGQRFRLPAPGCRLVGPACTGSVVSLAGVGASASGCLRPGPVWGGRRVRGRRGPWLGWGQRFRVPAPGCRLAGPASTWSAGSPVGVGPVPPVACARVSPRVPGVYGVSRVPGRRGASASGCLRQGVVRRGRRVRGWPGRGRSGVQRFRALPSFPSPPFPPFPPSPLGAFAPSCRQAAVTVGATRSPVVCLSGAATRTVRGQLVAPLEWIHALAVTLPGSCHRTRSIPWTPAFVLRLPSS